MYSVHSSCLHIISFHKLACLECRKAALHFYGKDLPSLICFSSRHCQDKVYENDNQMTIFNVSSKNKYLNIGRPCKAFFWPYIWQSFLFMIALLAFNFALFF